jgi:hypothetical protein
VARKKQEGLFVVDQRLVLLAMKASSAGATRHERRPQPAEDACRGAFITVYIFVALV